VIHFRDSQQLLINSLKNLAICFGVETQKSLFPYTFVNENNLNYIGNVPDLKYFDKVSKKDYNKYFEQYFNNWNLKEETEKYNIIDCVSLYEIIIKFNNMIFDLFKINIHKYPTLSSLAFAIFRTHFLKKDEIPQLSGQIAKDIRQSYTGGAIDMYIPTNEENTKIYAYDVNSLYPAQMENNFMPIGRPIFFKGDVRISDPNAFGLFYCKIIAPDNILHPILQTHVKINNMIRTIAPIGQWSDMLFSMEMDNAIKLGYKIEILWGYTFEKENIFKDYVDNLYYLKSEHPKTHPLSYIAKILLNSLYGRFGMDDNFTNINIIHKDYYSDFENKFFDQIEDKIDLGEYVLIFYNTTDLNKEEDKSTHNVSIAIAAAITAYSRIHMSIFKNNPKINLYYTDTDSIYTDSEVDENLISSNILGKLKVENISKKAIFLAPKLYCLLTESNEFIHKVKGLKHEVELTFEDFENLLVKDFSIQKSQTKWTRNLTEGKIHLLNELYTLKVTENKRKLIYKNNKLVGTKPYKIDSNKKIDTN
jgi:hypothetical protein